MFINFQKSFSKINLNSINMLITSNNHSINLRLHDRLEDRAL